MEQKKQKARRALRWIKRCWSFLQVPAREVIRKLWRRQWRRRYRRASRSGKSISARKEYQELNLIQKRDTPFHKGRLLKRELPPHNIFPWVYFCCNFMWKRLPLYYQWRSKPFVGIGLAVLTWSTTELSGKKHLLEYAEPFYCEDTPELLKLLDFLEESCGLSKWHAAAVFGELLYCARSGAMEGNNIFKDL